MRDLCGHHRPSSDKNSRWTGNVERNTPLVPASPRCTTVITGMDVNSAETECVWRALGSVDLMHRSACCVCLQNSWVHFTLTSYRVKYENTSHLSVGLLKTAGHTFTVPCPLPTRMYPSFRVEALLLEALPWLPLASSSVLTHVSKRPQGRYTGPHSFPPISMLLSKG